MITLSEFLGTIPCAGNAAESVQIAIREAKRLESLEKPRVEAERKPLVDGVGDNFYFVVDTRGVLITAWRLSREEAEGDAKRLATKTGQPHTVCQVMAPESGECPTIPVATFTPTPERPHEWVIYRDKGEEHFRWCYGHVHLVNRSNRWSASPTHPDVHRFATAHEAQDYIDENDIEDAYPWAVPTLTS